ncbi:alpha/beta hydrolase [Rubellimicrobium rubrum]|nr:alpha/beta hydrolase [Rubellimicrobium rubrum]
MRITEGVLRLRGHRLSDRVPSRSKRAEAGPSPWMRARYDVSRHEIQGRAVVTVRPRTGRASSHILYLHGGAYSRPLIRPHWWVVDRLIRATGSAVSVPHYPLAPESDHREAYRFLLATYAEMLRTKPDARPILAGDSAGGGLALGLALKLRDTGQPLPSRLILFSPWLDLTLTDPAVRDVEPMDAMLRIETLRQDGERWANGADPSSPYLSPLHADLQGLPPIQLFQGSRDLLAVDARSFAYRAEVAGHPIDYVEVPGGIHIYMAATWTPESRAAFRRIGTAIQESATLEPMVR